MTLDLKQKKVVVVGAGASGVAAARLAHRAQAQVWLNDIHYRPIPDLPENVQTVWGEHPESLFLSADLIVISPGVPCLAPVAAAEAAGIEVISEVELALRGIDADIGAVTGTNGKSTTVALLGELFATTKRPSFAGGNLGTPLSDVVETPAGNKGGLIALELSSFQLERTFSLHAQVATLLNLTEDHLDRYDSFEQYWRTKLNIFRNLPDHAVYNADDPLVMQGISHLACPKHAFSVTHSNVAFSLFNEYLCFHDWNWRFPISEMKLVGRHMMANALAAVGSALLMGVSTQAAEAVLSRFSGLAHRMTFCGEIKGVRFYDDSKATNVGSVMGSLSGWESPYVLLLGGRHKGAPYTPLLNVFQGKCRAVVALGESAPLIRADLAGHIPLQIAESFEDAVRRAAAFARPGDAVILSPACSSYDMFENYKERGQYFAQLVRCLTPADIGTTFLDQ